MNHRIVEPEKVLENILPLLSNMWLCKFKYKLIGNKYNENLKCWSSVAVTTP